MPSLKPIIIIGGGLAGLVLGVGLRRENVPVTIYEAGNYPRHRVCGEFISGRGQKSLERLGLALLLKENGAIPARTAAFYSAKHSSQPFLLPEPAWCLSRWRLDRLIADEFRRLGGDLHTGQRRDAAGVQAGTVLATGRRLSGGAPGSRWFGLKIHARQVPLEADLEMHASPAGYVGLCRVEDGAVNICGLFRRLPDDRKSAMETRQLLLGEPGSHLHRRLAAAQFDEVSFCAVAGLVLQPARAAERAEVSIGDAITMIPPVTGNGMSMAFESAELAVAPLAAWSSGQSAWAEVQREISRQCDRQFARRLNWAQGLQGLMLAGRWQDWLVGLAASNHWFCRLAFAKTR